MKKNIKSKIKDGDNKIELFMNQDYDDVTRKLDAKVDKMEICTVAKVGSKTIWESAKLTNKYKIHHIHSLYWLRERFVKIPNQITIVGIRNPLDRNISYFFEDYDSKYRTDVKIAKNKYKGEMMFFCEHDDICKYSANELINVFFKRSFHDTFNYWFEEFFEITGVDKRGFNKEKGYSIYKYPNNNYLLIYTLEKLDANQREICEFLGLKELIHANEAKDKIYYERYNEVKRDICFPESYKIKYLNTKTMKFFYTNNQIVNFYKKYPTCKKGVHEDFEKCKTEHSY